MRELFGGWKRGSVSVGSDWDVEWIWAILVILVSSEEHQHPGEGQRRIVIGPLKKLAAVEAFFLMQEGKEGRETEREQPRNFLIF